MLNNWRGDRRGSVVSSVGIFVLVVTTGGVALQTGMLYQAQEKLQTSANIAALAGASQLFTSASSAVTTANSYMGSNMVAGQTPSAATGYPLTKCLTSTWCVMRGDGRQCDRRQEHGVDEPVVGRPLRKADRDAERDGDRQRLRRRCGRRPMSS